MLHDFRFQRFSFQLFRKILGIAFWAPCSFMVGGLMNVYSRFRAAPAWRVLALAGLYFVVLFAARWMAWQLRFDFHVPEAHRASLEWQWVIQIPVLLFWLGVFGQFRLLLTYFSVPDFVRIVYAMAVGFSLLYAVRLLPISMTYNPPRGVVLINLLLSVASLSAMRVVFRVYREQTAPVPVGNDGRQRRTAIIGAGDAGAQLAQDLMTRRGLALRPVAFFDDNRRKWGSKIHGIPVVGAPELLPKRAKAFGLEEAVIAMPAAPAKRVGEVVRILQTARLRFVTVPSTTQLATGQVRVSQLRRVDIQDLLGREVVELQTAGIRDLLQNRTVLVTGAGGSIGAELCRQVASFNPKRLLLVEQCEVNLFQIEQELLGHGGCILPIVADILDQDRMRLVFSTHRPAIVFHAAAHKHVPLMEAQPGEAIKNNVVGTARLADLALEHGVERFVLVSTDKAIRPTSVMGATKRLAEMYLQARQAAATPPVPAPEKEGDRPPPAASSATKFVAVRFGNVLGSSGSVVPTFRRQIAAGGPVKVTHPEVTRYFMTIPEAVGLVLQSATQAAGGEIFVLDMGKPVKIVDLARQMIELSGLRPGEDIQIEFTGLRPGEKLFEELISSDEKHATTAHPKIMRLVGQPIPLEQVQQSLAHLQDWADTAEPNELKRMMQLAIGEYEPYLGA